MQKNSISEDYLSQKEKGGTEVGGKKMGYKLLSDTETVKALGSKLWNEIAAQIACRHIEQLLPVINLYNRASQMEEFPTGCKLELVHAKSSVSATQKVSTNISDPQNRNESHIFEKKYSYIESDILIKVENRYLYHFEIQITNDKKMALRMVKYDINLAIDHSYEKVADDHYVLQLPYSAVIYPSDNSNLPQNLSCTLIFPDGTEHQYSIPTIHIQEFSLEEIKEQKLFFFLPYTLLRFKKRVESKKNPLEKEDLTAYMTEVKMILEEALVKKEITQEEYYEYYDCISAAAKRVFANHTEYAEEVIKMTEPVTVTSVQYIEILEKQMEEMKKEMNEKLAEKDAEIAKLKAQIK